MGRFHPRAKHRRRTLLMCLWLVGPKLMLLNLRVIHSVSLTGIRGRAPGKRHVSDHSMWSSINLNHLYKLQLLHGASNVGTQWRICRSIEIHSKCQKKLLQGQREETGHVGRRVGYKLVYTIPGPSWCGTPLDLPLFQDLPFSAMHGAAWRMFSQRHLFMASTMFWTSDFMEVMFLVATEHVVACSRSLSFCLVESKPFPVHHHVQGFRGPAFKKK